LAEEGRWKLLILHHLLIKAPRRFSDLERAIPAVTQKMLIQQLRALESAGVVSRIAFQEASPHVEYALTAAGAALEPVLDALHDWAASGHLEATAGAVRERASVPRPRISSAALPILGISRVSETDSVS
jgi:DNA-binding HxlR family transcriptional regulator